MKLPSLALSLLLALPSAAISGGLPFDGSWKEQKFPGSTDNNYSQQGGSLSIASDNAVSILFKSIPESQWGAKSAKWSWNVSQSVPATPLTQKGGDDRNAALYFVFAPQEVAAKLKGKGIVSVLKNKNAKALVYVHGGNHGRGKVFQSPYMAGRGVTKVLRNAGTGSNSESVNLAKDFQAHFGSAPAVLIGVGISADSDDTASSIRATISGLSIN